METPRFSCAELAKMELPGLPTTSQGWIDLVQRENWPFAEYKSRGRHGKTKKYQPPQNILALIQKFLSENPDFFSHERELPDEAIHYEKHSTRPLVSGDEKHNGLVLKDTGHSCQDSIYIEHYVDVRGAAGVGQVTPTDQMIISVAVNAVDWRNYVGLNPKHVKVISVYGDSMKPVLQHGDQVLVDTACNCFIDDAIYAIQQGDMLRIKRIKLRLDGSIEVKSDNDHGFGVEIYSKEEAAVFRVVGKVLPFKFGKFDL